MITLRRLNNAEFVLNAEYIESLESTPDTVVLLTTGKKIMVRNSLEEIVQKVIHFKQMCNQTVTIINSVPPLTDSLKAD